MHRVTLFLIVLALALSACAAEPAATSAPTEAAQMDEPYPAQVNSQPPPAADPYPAQAEQPAGDQPVGFRGHLLHRAAGIAGQLRSG